MNLNQIHKEYVMDPLGVGEFFSKSLLTFVQKYVKSQCKGKSGSMYDNLEDAVGGSLLKIWRDLPRFEVGKSAFEAFVITRIKDSIYEVYNEYGRQAEVELVEDVSSPPTHKGIEAKLSVKALLSTLCEEDKLFVSMKIDGLPDQEIADNFSQNRQWAWNKWYRIKENLRVLGAEKGLLIPGKLR